MGYEFVWIFPEGDEVGRCSPLVHAESLQVKSLPIAVATNHWESMMSGGWIMASNNQVPGGRVFRSQEGTQVWEKMGRFLNKTVSRYNENLQVSFVRDDMSRGRKRGPDEDEEGRKRQRQEFSFGGVEPGSWD
jgi:hypothetical protein